MADTANSTSATRRLFLAAGSAATVFGTLNAAAMSSRPTQQELAEAYSQWLFMERRLLSLEMGWPAKFVPGDTFAGNFHFPGDRDWQDVPKPTTRAAAVFAAVGCK